MRFLLTSIGSSGDINPFIALGLALAARGHEPVLLVNPYFEPAVRSAGLPFEPLGEYFSPVELARTNPGAFARYSGAWVLLRDVLIPAVPEMHRAILESAQRLRPGMIVGHQISFGMPWAARRAGVPFATCVLAPATLLSVSSPPVYQVGLDLTRWPSIARRLYARQSRALMSVMLDGPLNDVRRGLGLAPVRDTFFGEMLSGAAVLGMWSPALRPPAPDDPPNMKICGFPWFDRSGVHGGRGEGLAPEVSAFLEAGPPPVVFTLGSVLSGVASREYAAAAGACADLGVRALLITGKEGRAPDGLPRTVAAVDYAPYGALLHRGAATVHHGGIGTTAQALRAGRPSIIAPHTHDQFDNAARVQRLGAGRWVAQRTLLSRRALARAIDQTLRDQRLRERATEVGAAVGAEDGAAEAARLVDGLAAASTRCAHGGADALSAAPR